MIQNAWKIEPFYNMELWNRGSRFSQIKGHIAADAFYIGKTYHRSAFFIFSVVSSEFSSLGPSMYINYPYTKGQFFLFETGCDGLDGYQNVTYADFKIK